MKSQRTHRFLLALALLGVPGAAAAVTNETALGSDGTVYRVRAGSYGTLFPGGRQTAAENSVLALDLTRPEGLVRLAVPETLDHEVEASPAVVFEDAGDSVFLLWEARVNAFNRVLRLASFDGADWSPVIDVAGNAFADKTAPQLAITHDRFVVGNQAHDRTILHVVWGEKNGAEVYETFYSPLIIEDGAYRGHSGLFRLNDYDPSPAAAAPIAGDALLRSPSLQAGRDGRTLTVAFADSPSRRLVVLEIDALPRAVSSLADTARAHVIGIGAKYLPNNVAGLAEAVRVYVNGAGNAFQPEVTAAIANSLRDQIMTGGGKDTLVAIANKARAHVIGIGGRLVGSRGLVQASKVAGPAVRTAEIATPDGSVHLFQLRVASSRPLPDSGAGSYRLFASESGEDVIVSWQQGDLLSYRDSTADGWTAVHQLKLGPALDLATAHQVLLQRVRRR